ncbi:unnamed protein product, partial [Menidia menidia]
AELLVPACGENPPSLSTRRLARGSGWVRVNLDLDPDLDQDLDLDPLRPERGPNEDDEEFEFDVSDLLFESNNEIYAPNQHGGRNGTKETVGLGAVLALLGLSAVLFLANCLPCTLRDRRGAKGQRRGEGGVEAGPTAPGCPPEAVLHSLTRLRGFSFFSPAAQRPPDPPLAGGPQPRADCWCTLRLQIQAKRLPQCWQWKGFSPVCTRWCFFRLPASEKLRPQVGQWNGRSPVWTRRWASRLDRPQKALPHRRHTKRLALRRWTVGGGGPPGGAGGRLRPAPGTLPFPFPFPRPCFPLTADPSVARELEEAPEAGAGSPSGAQRPKRVSSSSREQSDRRGLPPSTLRLLQAESASGPLSWTANRLRESSDTMKISGGSAGWRRGDGF